MSDIGFIGLGRMGGPMAANLIRGGHRLWGYDTSESAMARAVETGAIPCASPREASQGREFVFLSLPHPRVVEAVVLGPEGVLSAFPAPRLLIDTTTSLPGVTRRLAASALEKGCEVLDAPISGGTAKAVDGTLSIMVGGAPDALERAMPLLRLIGKEIFHVGSSGTGHAVKLVNNLILSVSRVAIAEAFVMGVLAGVEPKKIHEVVSASTGNSWAFQDMAYHLMSRDFEPSGTVEVLRKDMELATQLGWELGMPMTASGVAREMYQAAKAAGLGEMDSTAVAIPLERLMGKDTRDTFTGGHIPAERRGSG